METTRFKSDPYNPVNRLLTASDVIRIGQSVHLSIPVSDITIYQKAFIHTSYTELLKPTLQPIALTVML